MKQTKLIFSKSLNHPHKCKEEYIARRIMYFKSFGINATHANIVMMDFGISVYDWMRKPLTKKERLFLYKRRGTYANNRVI